MVPVTPPEVLAYLGMPADTQVRPGSRLDKITTALAEIPYPADGDNEAHLVAFTAFLKVARPLEPRRAK